jgi:succinate dehydrogenase/fumarate reductase flavoprotein subunit
MHLTDETLAWTGSEDSWPYIDKAEAAPRGHKVESPHAGGHILVDRLMHRCRELNVKFQFDSRVTALFHENGRVTGVRYREAGVDTDVRAKRAVILATGGYEWNKEMSAEYTPEIALEGVSPLGAPTADGAGILLGMAMGARLLNMDGYNIDTAWYPPEGLIRGILVNKHGQRFINEDVYHGRSSAFIMRQPDIRAYLICDNKVFDRPTSGMGHQLVGAWETIAEMEREMQLPEGSLQKTMADYNRAAAKGEDPTFHKSAHWLVPLDEPPFGAFDCSLGAAYFPALSMGGLATTFDGEVLAKNGAPIAGLYAAGVMAPSIAYHVADYSSGLLLGTGTFFGRRAGWAAARAGSGPQ